MVLKFTNSCAPISYPCTVGNNYINPCTCRGYFECETGFYNFLQRDCGPGTAWNHVTEGCDNENKIFIGNGTPVCERNEPWSRCMSVLGHYKKTQLEKLCNPSSQGGGGGADDGGDGSGDNAAGIVGGVLGGLLLIVLVTGLLIWWKKHRGHESKNSHHDFRPSVQKQNKEMEEEVYDIIDEKSVSPAISNITYGEGIEYDNPAFDGKAKEDNNNYTNLQPRQPRDHEPTTSFNQPADHLSPEHSTISKRQYLSEIAREDMSRSISVGGKAILVQDSDGYQVGYPSGSVPRQPSPIHPDDAQHEAGLDYGYDLGKAPLPIPNDYIEHEKTDL